MKEEVERKIEREERKERKGKESPWISVLLAIGTLICVGVGVYMSISWSKIKIFFSSNKNRLKTKDVMQNIRSMKHIEDAMTSPSK